MDPREHLNFDAQSALRPATAAEYLEARAFSLSHHQDEKPAKSAQQRRIDNRRLYQRSVKRKEWGQTGDVENVGVDAIGSDELVQPVPPPAPLWTRPPVVDWREECRGRYGDRR